mgnify:FL=1
MKPEELEFRQRSKESYQRGAFFWIDLANQRLGDFNRQLLALAVVLLPLTASISLSSIKLKDFEKTLLVLSWIALGVSIITGIIQILIDTIYFKDLSRDSSKREKIWSNFSRKVTDLEKETKAIGEVKESGSHDPLKIQASSLFIGLILIMVVAGFILFAR